MNKRRADGIFGLYPKSVFGLWTISDEKFYCYETVTFVQVFCFYQVGLCSASYIANEYSIYHFSVMIKD